MFNLKISDSNLCTYRYCNSKDVDSIRHYLITCTPVVTFWNNFVSWWNKLNFSKLFPLVEENIILGFPTVSNEDIVLNFCLILAKHYIYTSKRNQTDLFFGNYIIILKNKLDIEKHINKCRSTLDKFYYIWGYLLESLWCLIFAFIVIFCSYNIWTEDDNILIIILWSYYDVCNNWCFVTLMFIMSDAYDTWILWCLIFLIFCPYDVYESSCSRCLCLCHMLTNVLYM